jgi:type I restriction enzyme S subunit
MELKHSYKQTEVGLIPKEWDDPQLAKIAKEDAPICYGIVQVGSHIASGIPVLAIKNLNSDYATNIHRASPEIERPYSRSRIRPNDVLISIKGTTGRIGIVPPGLHGNISRDLARLRLREGINPGFCFQMLQSELVQRRLANAVVGTTRMELSIAILKKVRIPLPPSNSEQEAIAEVLSDADAPIESLEQLIAKRRHLKRGVMQELLTGQKRLPGFSGEWNTQQLGQVIDHCSSGATPYRGRPEYYKGTVKWITSGELNYNVITDTREHISEDAVKHTNLKMHPVGTFLMAITGLEAAGTRGACGIVGSPATTNQSCMAIYPSSKLKSEYLYHYYVLRGNDLALRYCQGTKQQSYTAKLVNLLPIDLPPWVDEQSSIAAILSDMDAEIAALEAKVAKARQIKQGMMQQLLSGRIRLL